MRIDMSPEAIRKRLEQVRALRNLCLSLARSSAAREIIKAHPENRHVKRTSQALGK